MKKLLSLLLAFVMLFALAACGAADDAADDAAADDAAADDAAADDAAADDAAADDAAADDAAASGDFNWADYEGVTFQIMWQESDSTQIDIVENFCQPALQAISDEYGIVFEWVGNTDQSYTTLAATGQLADVWFGNVTLEMIESDIMLDLTPYLTADSYMEDTFTTPSFYYFNDVIWALSTGVDSFYNGVLYYNKAVFEANGIDEADLATYEGLVSICEKLNAAGIQPLTFEGKQGGCYQRFLWQNCVISVDPEAYKTLLTGDKAALQNPAIEAGFAQIRDLFDAGYLGQALAVRETDTAIADFGYGDVAMLYCDSWNNVAITDAAAGEFEIGTAWWPSANADYETGAYIAGWGSPLSGWCAKADTEYPELAVQVIKEINKAEAARHLAAGLGTNHVQDGTPTAANDIEASRFVLRESVGEFLKGWRQNVADANTITVFETQQNFALTDDAVVLADIVAEMDAAWQTNTFFG